MLVLHTDVINYMIYNIFDKNINVQEYYMSVQAESDLLGCFCFCVIALMSPWSVKHVFLFIQHVYFLNSN